VGFIRLIFIFYCFWVVGGAKPQYYDKKTKKYSTRHGLHTIASYADL
jgi:hypothetical protein